MSARREKPVVVSKIQAYDMILSPVVLVWLALVLLNLSGGAGDTPAPLLLSPDACFPSQILNGPDVPRPPRANPALRRSPRPRAARAAGAH